MSKRFQVKNQVSKVFNFGVTELTAKWNAADPAEPAVLMIYDAIGKDPWSGCGMSAKDFASALNEVKGRDLHIRINSKGGDVHEGMAIKSMLDEWPGKVVCTIDGIAASTASWIPMGADEVRASKNSQVFIHDALAFGMGNAEDFRKTADDLDKISDQIAGMYAERTGKRVDTMRKLMKDETLLTGQEAEEMGLVDTIISEKAVRNFLPEELTTMKEQLRAFNSARQGGAGHKPTNTMNKKKIIALLNKHGVTAINGVTIYDETPDEHLEAALEQVLNAKQKQADVAPRNQDFEVIRNELNEIKEANKRLTELNQQAEKTRITNEVDGLIANDQVTKQERDKAIARAVKDPTYLDELKSRPSRPPGGEPLSAPRVESVGDSFSEVQNFILDNGPRFTNNFIGANAGRRAYLGDHGCLEVRDRSIAVANMISKHKKMLVEMFNTNTIDAGLQRQVILQDMVEEFAVVLAPFRAFSTVYSNVPLEGTDVVGVPFYDLASDSGNSWAAATGYNTMGNTTTGIRNITVGGSGTNSGSSAAANTAKDRKWVGLEFSSYELARQPYVNWQKQAQQKANRLGVLIFTDIISRVITSGNFGAAVKAGPAAGFSADDVADLWGSATGLNWPSSGRSLIVAHTYWQALIKDPAFKQYLAAGTDETLRRAAISSAYGFENMYPVPNLTTYSPTNENLVGWINWMYAVLIATAPIMPTADVRALMTRYDIVTEPKTGVTFEYRRFGNVTLDKTQETIECSYGAAKGVASALARITSQ